MDGGSAEVTDIITIAVVDGGGGVVLVEADFNTDEEDFIYVDDAFLGTSEPAFSEGLHLPNGGFSGGGLQVILGGVDDINILDMSGGWELEFVLQNAQEITLTFLFNLIQASDYESDEISEALLAVDGNLVAIDGFDFLAQIVGDGNGGPNQSTRWIPIGVSLGNLSVGAHTITLGGYNNQKTFNNEVTEILIDEVTIRGESGTPPPPNDDIILEHHFDGDEEGFVFEDDAFRQTENPTYASGNHLPTGGFTGGGLQVLLGNIDTDDILGMSGAWTQSFTLDEPAEVTLSFRYNLTQASDYEADEFSEALVSLDGSLVGPSLNSSLVRITGDGNGGPNQTTGWVLVELDLGVLPADEVHVLHIGAFNNKKTFFDEITELRIDDVILRKE